MEANVQVEENSSNTEAVHEIYLDAHPEVLAEEQQKLRDRFPAVQQPTLDALGKLKVVKVGDNVQVAKTPENEKLIEQAEFSAAHDQAAA